MTIYCIEEGRLYEAALPDPSRFPAIGSDPVYCLTQAQLQAAAVDPEEVDDDYEELEDALQAAEHTPTPEAVEVRTACRRALGFYEPQTLRKKAVLLYSDGYTSRPQDVDRLKRDELLTDDEAALYLSLFDEFAAKDCSFPQDVDVNKIAEAERIVFQAARTLAEEIPADLFRAGQRLEIELSNTLTDGDYEEIPDLLDRGLDPEQFRNLAAYSSFSRCSSCFFDGTYTQRQIERTAQLVHFFRDIACDLETSELYRVNDRT